MWLLKWASLRGSPSLYPLMVVEQRILATGIEWTQVALASLIDSVVFESFWQRAIPSSQTNFHWWASMEDLIASSSHRTLLASSLRWAVSEGGTPLLGPGVSAVGEEAAGISSREVSSITASSRALTWDDVSTGQGKSSTLVDEGGTRTTGSSLFGVEFPDACPDMSNPTWDRSSLTSMVMLTSLSTFGRGALTGLAIGMEEECTLSVGPSTLDCGMSTFR